MLEKEIEVIFFSFSKKVKAYIPWTARRSNPSILKEICPECSLEGLMLKLKLQYSGHLMWRADSFEKTLILGKMKQEEKTEDEMVGWHYWLNGHDFELSPGVGDGQGGLACGSPCGLQKNLTGLSNWTEMNWRQQAEMNTRTQDKLNLGKEYRKDVGEDT